MQIVSLIDPMDKVKIIIADDHALVLEGMLRLSEGSFDVLEKAYNGVQLLELSNIAQPDVYVVDVNMPEMSGLDAARKLLECHPTAKILFISGETSPRRVQEALSVGGAGYISKNASYSELADAIQTIARGERYISADLQHELDKQVKNKVTLTPRQLSVLQLIAEGLTAKEIAFRLGLSPRTAEFHRQCIMERLSLRSTAELTRYAIENGLLERAVFASTMSPEAAHSA